MPSVAQHWTSSPARARLASEIYGRETKRQLPPLVAGGGPFVEGTHKPSIFGGSLEKIDAVLVSWFGS